MSKIMKCRAYHRITAFAMVIPKGCSSEEGVAGEKARSVEVVTASGEYQNPENCHARYPSGRHHCHTALPHVILCQHRQKTITLSHPYAERFIDIWCTCMRICICLYIFIGSDRGLFAHILSFVVYHTSFTQTITCTVFIIKNLRMHYSTNRRNI